MADGRLDVSGLRQIAAFVAVAETVNFGRAAERLGTTQPAVSRLILRLERRLGLVLFERTSHTVRVTGAGESLLEPARHALAAVEAFGDAANMIADGRHGVLRVGSTEGAGALTARVLERFSREHPDVEVRLEQDHTPAKLRRLQLGTLDAAFVRNAPATAGLRTIEISRERLVAVVSAHHPLADRPSIALAALAADPLLLTPAAANPWIHEAVLRLVETAGFTPKLGSPFYNTPDAIAQIAVSRAWTLLSHSALPHDSHDVRGIELDDAAASVGISLAWRSTGAPAVLPAFVHAAREAGAATV